MSLIAARHDKQNIVSSLIETYMSIMGEMKSSQRRTTEACPTDFTDSHGYYSVGLTKTDIHPLKRMEAEPDTTFFQNAAILFKAINRK